MIVAIILGMVVLVGGGAYLYKKYGAKATADVAAVETAVAAVKKAV